MSRDATSRLYLAVLAIGVIAVTLAIGQAEGAEPMLVDETLVGTCATGPVMRAALSDAGYQPIWEGSSDIVEDTLDRPMTLWETRERTWLWVAADDAGTMCVVDHGWRSTRYEHELPAH